MRLAGTLLLAIQRSMSRRHGSFSKARRFQIKASVQHGFLTGRWGRGAGPGRPGWLPTQAPGKEVALPPPPPLRTTRECFHLCSSSLSNAPCGTRLPLPQGCRVRTAQPASGENLEQSERTCKVVLIRRPEIRPEPPSIPGRVNETRQTAAGNGQLSPGRFRLECRTRHSLLSQSCSTPTIL